VSTRGLGLFIIGKRREAGSSKKIGVIHLMKRSRIIETIRTGTTVLGLEPKLDLCNNLS